MNGKNNNQIDSYLPRIRADIQRKFWMQGGFFLVAIFLKLVTKVILPIPLFLIVLFLSLINAGNYILFIKDKRKKAETVIDWYFLTVFLDIIALTVAIYYLGGIVWIGPFFYSLTIVNLFWLFPKNKAFFLIGACLLSLVTLISLQYLGAIPDFYAFPWDPWEENIVQSLPYVVVTAIGSLVVILILGFSNDLFRRTLERQITEISRAGKNLGRTKELLEIEVKNQTADLFQKKENLEKEIEERTKELEERKKNVQTRIKELERFHKVAVEREIKMIELKERISRLKDEEENKRRPRNL